MTHHVINNAADIENLMEVYPEPGILFESVESGEEFTLADLLYLYDGQTLLIEKV